MTTIKVNSANIEKISQAIDWCETQFEPRSWQFETQWPAKFYDFRFQRTQDATLFSLRWSGQT